MRKVELSFGTVHLSRGDVKTVSHEIEKAVEVNVNAILDNGQYRFQQDRSDRPHRLKVTVEIVGA